MEFQCFEIQIKTEADSNECSHDDKPSTGMFPSSGEQILFPVYCICIDVSIMFQSFFDQIYIERLLIHVLCVNITP